MDQPENTPKSSTAGGSLTEAELQDQVAALRSLVTSLLAAMLCVGLAVAIYLYRQVNIMNRQVTDAKKAVSEFQTNAMPRINWFVANLQAFGRTNPDFMPILAKYNLLPSNAPSAMPPGSPANRPSQPKK